MRWYQARLERIEVARRAREMGYALGIAARLLDVHERALHAGTVLREMFEGRRPIPDIKQERWSDTEIARFARTGAIPRRIVRKEGLAAAVAEPSRVPQRAGAASKRATPSSAPASTATPASVESAAPIEAVASVSAEAVTPPPRHSERAATPSAVASLDMQALIALHKNRVRVTGRAVSGARQPGVRGPFLDIDGIKVIASRKKVAPLTYEFALAVVGDLGVTWGFELDMLFHVVVAVYALGLGVGNVGAGTLWTFVEQVIGNGEGYPWSQLQGPLDLDVDTLESGLPDEESVQSVGAGQLIGLNYRRGRYSDSTYKRAANEMKAIGLTVAQPWPAPPALWQVIRNEELELTVKHLTALTGSP